MADNEPFVFLGFDENDAAVPGAKVYSYIENTTTPLELYADADLTTPLANPAICDGKGRLIAYMDPAVKYKFAVYTPDDATLLIPVIDSYEPRADNIFLIIGKAISNIAIAAAASAADAAASALSALGYKNAAEAARDLALDYRNAAQTAATTATAQATTATTQANAAASSASAAAGSASTASGAASSASSDASAAAGSAAAAATSETNAETAETNAEAAETNAIASEVSALGGASIVLTRLLGAHADDTAAATAFPTAPVGAAYYRTGDNKWRVVVSTGPIVFDSIDSAGTVIDDGTQVGDGVETVFTLAGAAGAQRTEAYISGIFQMYGAGLAYTVADNGADLDFTFSEPPPLDAPLYLAAATNVPVNWENLSDGALALGKLVNAPSAGFIGATGAGAYAHRTPAQVTAALDVMVGDSGSGGTKGLVPAPGAGDATKALLGNGTYGTISAGVTDGDKGEIVVSSSGTVWTIDTAATPRVAKLGIGVAAASGDTPLTVKGTNTTDPQIPDFNCLKENYWSFNFFDVFSDTAGHSAFTAFRRARGSLATPSAVQSGDALGGVAFRGYAPAGAYVQPAIVNCVVDAAPSGSSVPSALIFGAGTTIATERMRIASDGKVGVGTASATALLDVNSDIIRLRTAKTPASAGAAGNAGDMCWDASYFYICTATNTWRRIAHSSW